MADEPKQAPLVLVVERDRNVQDLQSFYLTRGGFAVEVVDDGMAALDRARQAAPALVIVEILIPKLDGLAVCRQLRDDPSTRSIPVIVFSILAAAARAEEAGARAFLRKPLVESTFLAAVRNAIAAEDPATMQSR